MKKDKKNLGMSLGKSLAALAIGLLALACTAVQARAADGYSYTVNIYAGNNGTFTEKIEILVDHSESGSMVECPVEIRQDRVTIKELKKDDLITITLGDDAVQLSNGDRYQVKGIRQSGRDNNTIATSIFRVDRDADYVLAYGMKGNMVAYTVNYQDAAGKELLPSDTFYGSVGDKPVVAYRYKEGYEPEVRALTKTLSKNKEENVFTFIYKEAPQGETQVVTRQVGTPGTTTTTVTDVIPGAVTTTTTIGEAPVPAGGGAAGGAAAEGEEAAEEEEGEADTEAEPEAPATTEIGDGEVPLANQDLQDLDDGEVPASDIQLDSVVKKGLPLAASIGIAVAAAAALAVGAVFVWKRKKKGKAL